MKLCILTYISFVDAISDCTLYLEVRTHTHVGTYVSIDTHIHTSDSTVLSCMKDKLDPRCTQLRL